MKTTTKEIEATEETFERYALQYAVHPPTKWEKENSRMVKRCKGKATQKRKSAAHKKQQTKELQLKEERKEQKLQIVIDGLAC